MILISYGVMKSGSTLAYEMARAVLELAGHPQDALPDDVVSPGQDINLVMGWSDDGLERLIDASGDRRIAVKTHGALWGVDLDLVRAKVASGDLKIHVVYRDPREMLISMLDHGVRARTGADVAFRDTWTLDDAIRRLGVQTYWFTHWASLPSLKLRYQDFAFDPTYGPKAIADDLGVSDDPARVWEIVNTRFTQKNEARPERYKTDLWPDELERIEAAFPLFLELVQGNDRGWFASSD
jgi:sulfotransferase family protein